jgi:putative Mn2+ efflux pump MntP
MVALLLVAASLGLSNFAASVGIGVGGVDARARLRVGIIFGIFETAMPILGLLAGRGLAGTLGRAAHWIGAALLIATGAYALIQAVRSQRSPPGRDPAAGAAGGAVGGAGQPTGRLLITGLALSIDNLAVGFALGIYHVGLVAAAVVIGAVSVAMSLIGLELGRYLGDRAGDRGEILGGLVLIGVGLAIAAGLL